MVEAQLSQRAQKILALLTPPFEKGGSGGILPIRQQSLAEEFNCSRRTIGRALKELKAAGLLIDLQKRHENRCKMYEVKIPLNPPLLKGEEKNGLTHHAQVQWELYAKTFRIIFTAPDLEQQYGEVTWELRQVTEEMELWRKTWAGLRVAYGHPPLP